VVKQCSEEGCDAKRYCKGLCCTHYRLARYGIDESGRKRKLSDMEAENEQYNNAMGIWNSAVGL